ncbi:conserved hypothetical protein [Haloferula helveola]|uniref:Lipoprotein n=2 Tax=Haloferula helveola TaxID=490095 RepID=A0ABM7RGJ1_9BACT|nr:conserved hypothetical protein [Haloferula helveola]
MLLGFSLILGACGKREEVTATETRPTTMRDENLQLDATSDERFKEGRPAPATSVETPPSPVVAETVPEGWKAAPGSSFRLLNYTFGTKGEAYVSLSRGGVLENVNRWLGQFGAEKLDAAGLEKLKPIEVAGFKGVWVSVDGDFGGGMGKAAESDWSLRGVVAAGPQGILTVKMLGPTVEVTSEDEALKAFVAGLETAK